MPSSLQTAEQVGCFLQLIMLNCINKSASLKRIQMKGLLLFVEQSKMRSVYYEILQYNMKQYKMWHTATK